MNKGSKIVAVTARQISSERGYPAIEATVTTENGATGSAVAVAGTSTGEHEIKFAYDGGKKWNGKGVLKAVSNVCDLVSPALIGEDASQQCRIDGIILDLDGTPDKSHLGGNATASVSAAVLKAGAASLGIPLYRHIGGVNACTLPVPGVHPIRGSTRYGGGQNSGGKPSYIIMCYGYDTFAEASYAGWEVTMAFQKIMHDRYNMSSEGTGMGATFRIQAGMVEHDRELWKLMLEAINIAGQEGKMGLQIDSAASTYYDKKKQVYSGLFSTGDKTRDEMIELYREMVEHYQFMILEDPLDENDYEGHAVLTRELGIQIVGDDLFTTSMERLQHGISITACNAMLLKVNQVGTISEAFDAVQLAYLHGYGVMPCASRGEGDAIADYSVGLGAGTVILGALGSTGDRFIAIEEELGNSARFLGKDGFKGSRNLAR